MESGWSSAAIALYGCDALLSELVMDELTLQRCDVVGAGRWWWRKEKGGCDPSLDVEGRGQRRGKGCMKAGERRQGRKKSGSKHAE